MGPGVKIFLSNHPIDDTKAPMNIQPYVERDIVIGNDVWLGSNSVVIVRVIIGEGSVIAAGSVVTKNIPGYVIAAGVPAKPIESRR
jgi:acetyltransferase-like isoleucine patch superfamily enzyme